MSARGEGGRGGGTRGGGRKQGGKISVSGAVSGFASLGVQIFGGTDGWAPAGWADELAGVVSQPHRH